MYVTEFQKYKSAFSTLTVQLPHVEFWVTSKEAEPVPIFTVETPVPLTPVPSGYGGDVTAGMTGPPGGAGIVTPVDEAPFAAVDAPGTLRVELSTTVAIPVFSVGANPDGTSSELWAFPELEPVVLELVVLEKTCTGTPGRGTTCAVNEILLSRDSVLTSQALGKQKDQ